MKLEDFLVKALSRTAHRHIFQVKVAPKGKGCIWFHTAPLLLQGVFLWPTLATGTITDCTLPSSQSVPSAVILHSEQKCYFSTF